MLLSKQLHWWYVIHRLHQLWMLLIFLSHVKQHESSCDIFLNLRCTCISIQLSRYSSILRNVEYLLIVHSAHHYAGFTFRTSLPVSTLTFLLVIIVWLRSVGVFHVAADGGFKSGVMPGQLASPQPPPPPPPCSTTFAWCTAHTFICQWTMNT